MKIVIGLGGSLLTRKLTPENFKKYAKVLIELKKKGHEIVVICGGGKTSRKYQKIAKSFKVSNTFADKIGILATYLNAMLLIAALGKHAHQKIFKTEEEVKKVSKNKILVCGGNFPGHSTDYDSALFAKAIKADLLIKATNVNGVYSSDPRKNPRAKKFDKLSYKEFERIISKNKQGPGEHDLFDLSAIKIIKNSKIKTVIVNGKDAREILKAVEGKDKGTKII